MMSCNNVMLNNHLIVPILTSETASKMISFYLIFNFIFASTLFCLLLKIQCKIRYTMHPFFGILFALIIICYILCYLAEIGCQLMFIIDQKSAILPFAFRVSELTYFIITPLCLCCVIERLIATIWAVSYENYRNWTGFILTIIASIALFFCYDNIKFGTGYEINVVTALILSGCLGLYFINRRMTFRYQRDITLLAKVTLSNRYQIIENMLVVRKVLLPVIVFDSFVTISDYLASYFQAQLIDTFEDKIECPEYFLYLPHFFLSHISMLFEYIIPIYIIMNWKAYQKNLPTIIKNCFSSCRKVSPDSGPYIIENVFGHKLNVTPTQNEYFNSLKNRWK